LSIIDLPDGYQRGNNITEVYHFYLNVTPSHTESSLVSLPFALPSGIIRKISIEFPRGCLDHVFVRVCTADGIGVIPDYLSTAHWITGDGYRFDFDVFRFVTSETSAFKFEGYSITGTSFDHIIVLTVSIEKVDVP